jgi:hypothetical protein
MGAHAQNVVHKKRFPVMPWTKYGTHNLKSNHTAYLNTTPIQILQHLDTKWCPLDVHAKKNLCMAYYEECDSKLHLLAFGKRLNNDQVPIEHFGITISDKDKLHFYIEKMYT